MQRILLVYFFVTLFMLIAGNYAMAQTVNKITKSANVFIKVCADSINSLKETDSIPGFVYNERFDYQNEYWRDLHHPIPIRKLIVDRLNNKAAIERILITKNEQLYKKYLAIRDTIGLNYYTMPYIKKSFGELLEDRLAVLRNRK